MQHQLQPFTQALACRKWQMLVLAGVSVSIGTSMIMHRTIVRPTGMLRDHVIVLITGSVDGSCPTTSSSLMDLLTG